MKYSATVVALAVSLGLSQPAAAYTVYVSGSAPIEMQVMPAMGTINATLAEILTTETQIGTAIVQASDKQVSAVTEAARAQREADIFGRQTERLERARDSFTVTDSICSESASGMATQVSKQTRSSASRLSGGGGVSSAMVRKSVASLPVAPVKVVIAVRLCMRRTVRQKRRQLTGERIFAHRSPRCPAAILSCVPSWMVQELSVKHLI